MRKANLHLPYINEKKAGIAYFDVKAAKKSARL